MSIAQVAAHRATHRDPRRRCVLVLGLSLTWTFLSMRTVMDVGGACADGGPYVERPAVPGGAG